MPNNPIIITAFANEYHNGRYLQFINEENTGINASFKARKLNDFFEIFPITGANIEAIRKTLADKDFQNQIVAFHYGGHADGENLMLQTETGLPQLTSAQTLADFLSQQEHLQLVFLNGCATRGQVEKLKRVGIPYIIATDRNIDDMAATHFAIEFYKALATGERNINVLFKVAKNALQNNSLPQSDTRKLWKNSKPFKDNFSWTLYESENHAKNEKLGEWFVNQNNKEALLTQAPAVPPKAFIGRNTDLKKVHTLLENNDNVVLVNGIGGIGKSTLAQAYWHKHQHQYSFLAWVTVVNDNLQESFLNSGLEQKLNIQIPEKTTLEERYQVLQRELSQLEGIKLLVLDNMNEPNLVHEFELPNWKVMMTSRASIPHYLQHTVGILSKEDAKMLFSHYHPAAKKQAEILEQLLEGVGYHTLTIELLAKNLQQLHGKGYDLGDLYENLEEKGLLQPNKSRKVRTNYRKGEKLRYERIISEMFDLNPLEEYAQWLLLQFSVLPAIPIDYQLMSEFLQIDEENSPFEGGKGDVEEFDETLEDLVERGWLEKRENGYKIHQVVQEVVREKIEPNGDNCGVLVNSLVWKTKEDNNYQLESEFLRHSNKLLRYIDTQKTKGIAVLADNVANIYQNSGNYRKALQLQKLSISILEKILVQNPLDLAKSYNNISITYRYLGKYDNALIFNLKSITLHKENSGQKNIHLARYYNNTALTYQALGNYYKALQLHLKSISIRKEVLSSKHLDLATSYNNIALTYQSLGLYSQALSFQLDAILIRKELLGTKHHLLATSYNTIAVTYQALKKPEKALEFQQKCISIREETLGEKHPLLANSFNNIAATYKKMGKYTQALEFQMKDMVILKEVLGEKHPDLATSYSNIATIYYALGDYNQALQSQQKDITILEEVLDFKHPKLAISYMNIAAIYYKMKNWLLAQKYINQSAQIFQHNFSKGHPDLDNALKWQQKIKEALKNTQSSPTKR